MVEKVSPGVKRAFKKIIGVELAPEIFFTKRLLNFPELVLLVGKEESLQEQVFADLDLRFKVRVNIGRYGNTFGIYLSPDSISVAGVVWDFNPYDPNEEEREQERAWEALNLQFWEVIVPLVKILWGAEEIYLLLEEVKEMRKQGFLILES